MSSWCIVHPMSQKIKEYLYAIGTLVFWVGLFIGLGVLSLSGDGGNTSDAYEDPAVESYEAQEEAEAMQESYIIEQERAEQAIEDQEYYESLNEIDSNPVYSVPQETYYECPITTCNDGTCSSSTGRGTCSWHDGIAY